MTQVISTDTNRETQLREFWLRVCERMEPIVREIISIEMLLQGQPGLAKDVRHDN